MTKARENGLVYLSSERVNLNLERKFFSGQHGEHGTFNVLNPRDLAGPLAIHALLSFVAGVLLAFEVLSKKMSKSEKAFKPNHHQDSLTVIDYGTVQIVRSQAGSAGTADQLVSIRRRRRGPRCDYRITGSFQA